MNIRKVTSNRPLLTIDDPTIYQGEYSSFVRSAEVGTTTACTEENVLYLVGSGSDRVPYVKTPTGVEILPNPFSRGPTLPYPNAQNIHQLNDNLVAIDNHLYALRKELSYWNLYEISYSVDNADAFSQTLASLAPGEALIINLDGVFNYEGEQYTRGDVVLRLTDGTYTTIKAAMTGFYYPSKVEQVGKNFKLTYAYYGDGQQPNTGEHGLSSTPLSQPYETEFFSIPVASAADSFMYGIRYDMSATDTYTFTAVKHNNNVIPPIIKFFTINQEEVAVDFTCVYDNASQYTLTINGTAQKPAGNTNNKLKYVYIK